MVSKSTTVILLVVFCSLQSTNADIITDILKGLSNAVNASVTNIKKDIKNFRCAAEKISKTISSRIIEDSANAAKNFESGVSKAQSLGANISQCVNGANSGISAIIQTAQSGMKVCHANSNAALEPDMIQLDNNLEAARDLILKATQNHTSCGFLNIICQGNVVLTAGAQAAALTAKSLKDAAEMALDLAVVQSAFNACSAEVIGAAISNATSTYAQEGDCVAEKLRSFFSS